MIIDISLYGANKAMVQGLFKQGSDVSTHISMMSSSFGIPAVVVAYWAGEITNWHPDALAAIKRLTAFYGYTEVRNKPEGSPV